MTTPESTMELDREGILQRIAELKRDKPPGWKLKGRALCNDLGDKEELPHPKRPATRGPALHDGTQLAFEDDGCLTQAVAPASHDEFSEVLDIVRAHPEYLLRLLDRFGLKVAPATSDVAKHVAHEDFKAGIAEGVRRLLKFLFEGEASANEICARAVIVAVVQGYEDSPVKTIRAIESLTSLSHGTLQNRVRDFRASPHGIPELTTDALKSPDSIGLN